jgi:hypothetical protein
MGTFPFIVQGKVQKKKLKKQSARAKIIRLLKLMHSQIVMGWLSKNFDLQGLVFFQGRRHTYGMSRS